MSILLPSLCNKHLCPPPPSSLAWKCDAPTGLEQNAYSEKNLHIKQLTWNEVNITRCIALIVAIVATRDRSIDFD
jgi:hypothetical protein